MKKQALSFLLDSNWARDPKVLRLIRLHGWEAAGLYLALIGLLRESSDYTVSRDSIEDFAYSLNVDPQKLETIVDFCINVGLLDLDQERNLFSRALDQRMEAREAGIAQRRSAGKSSAIVRSTRILQDSTAVEREKNLVERENLSENSRSTGNLQEKNSLNECIIQHNTTQYNSIQNNTTQDQNKNVSTTEVSLIDGVIKITPSEISSEVCRRSLIDWKLPAEYEPRAFSLLAAHYHANRNRIRNGGVAVDISKPWIYRELLDTKNKIPKEKKENENVNSALNLVKKYAGGK